MGLLKDFFGFDQRKKEKEDMIKAKHELFVKENIADELTEAELEQLVAGPGATEYYFAQQELMHGQMNDANLEDTVLESAPNISADMVSRLEQYSLDETVAEQRRKSR